MAQQVGRAFSPPQAVLYHSSSGFVVTAVGKQLLKYDIATGAFLGYFPDFRYVTNRLHGRNDLPCPPRPRALSHPFASCPVPSVCRR